MYNMVTEQSSLEELRKAFDALNHRMEELEAEEPDGDSAEYAVWEESCEQLALRSESIMTWIDHKMSEAML